MNGNDVAQIIQKYGQPVYDAALRQVYVEVALRLFWIVIMLALAIASVKTLRWCIRKSEGSQRTRRLRCRPPLLDEWHRERHWDRPFRPHKPAARKRGRQRPSKSHLGGHPDHHLGGQAFVMNAKRRRKIADRVSQGRPIQHLVNRARNLRWMPDAMAALRKELKAAK